MPAQNFLSLYGIKPYVISPLMQKLERVAAARLHTGVVSMTLDSDTGKWTVGGASVDKFFITKNGTFKFVGIPWVALDSVIATSAWLGRLNTKSGDRFVGAVCRSNWFSK